jgi:hypothetical protein
MKEVSNTGEVHDKSSVLPEKTMTPLSELGLMPAVLRVRELGRSPPASGVRGRNHSICFRTSQTRSRQDTTSVSKQQKYGAAQLR